MAGLAFIAIQQHIVVGLKGHAVLIVLLQYACDRHLLGVSLGNHKHHTSCTSMHVSFLSKHLHPQVHACTTLLPLLDAPQPNHWAAKVTLPPQPTPLHHLPLTFQIKTKHFKTDERFSKGPSKHSRQLRASKRGSGHGQTKRSPAGQGATSISINRHEHY
eukprot:1161810-Pelagomonas_calceolata.AAC.6